MASTRLKMAPVIGSAQWIQSEREQADQFHQLEVEEFGFAATNELEWLNEHMSDIFSKDVQRNFADVFKTPGKLRAKTPATARKRDAMVTRAPLGDLFAPNSQTTLASAVPNNSFYDRVAQFKAAEDEAILAPQKAGTSRRSPLRPGKENADSGYHGITEDEMDTDSRHPSNATQSTFDAHSFMQSVAADPELDAVVEDIHPDTRPEDDIDAVESAHEDDENALPDTQETDNATIPDEEMHDEDDDDEQHDHAQPSSPLHQKPSPQKHVRSDNWELENDDQDDAPPEAMDEDDQAEQVRSPSDISSPENRLVRKSSLTFAALPAREPLNRSIGARSSHVDVFGRSSVLGRHTHGKSLGANHQPVEHHHDDVDAEQVNQAAQEHSKSSTQRLHDRINALGQSKEPRPSKSIPSAINNSAYPVLPKEDVSMNDEDDDDWIAPINPNSRHGSGADTNLTRMDTAETLDTRPSTAASLEEHPPVKQHYLGHQKSFSTISLMSPGKLEPSSLHQKSGSVSHPNLTHAPVAVQSTTPTSVHSKKFTDAPLSASKAKLFSVLKSAKGIFASSASTSAQAKLDNITSPSRETVASTSTALENAVSRMPGGFDNEYSFPPKPVERLAEGRKTRSSTEHERNMGKESNKHNEDPLAKARQEEAEKAHLHRINREKAAEKERPATAGRLESPTKAVEDDGSDVDDMPPPPAPKALVQPGKLRAPGTGRLVRPTRPATAPGVRPAPVSIKIASQSQRLGTAQPADRSLEPTPPPTAPKTATGRVRAGSAQPTGSKANPASTARVRALEAAARKKEQDEKAAQRKVEQKRELERKRAAKADEERRVEEERKAAEQKRVREERIAEQRRIQDARAAAQKQAEQRKLEEQRLHVAQEKARAEQLAAALEQEKQEKQRAQAAYPRGDVQGTLRQLAQKEISRPTVPAKSSKRALAEPEDDAQQRPGLQRGPASYQSQDNKRRRTLEEEEGALERHSVMAPPKRPSNMRKNTQEAFSSKFPNGYTHAPPPASHHSQGMNMYKTAVTTQHQLQHGGNTTNKPPMHPNDMLKLSTARIPFADASNGPVAAASNSSQYTQETAASSSKTPVFKTPGRPASAMPKSAKSVLKSSPLYANGENIALPEIQTDSEDESDSDVSDSEGGNKGNNGGFRAPSWVNSPALRDLLTQQQLVDPESVFGPIAPLMMEEVFKGTKTDRLKRFRERGSSARWVESGDQVTAEEKRRDGEMRERLFREGGWSYSQQQM